MNSNPASASGANPSPSPNRLVAQGQGNASNISRQLRDKPKSPGRDTGGRRVSWNLPDEVASIQVAVIEPGPVFSRECVGPPPLPEEGINCFFVDQISELTVAGIPLTDLWFAMFSMILLLGSNVFLVNLSLKLFLNDDIRFSYVLGWLILDRLVAVFYRCWSAKYKSGLNMLGHIIMALTFLDILATSVMLIYKSNGSYMVNLLSLEGTKEKKQWTALPFLSAPPSLVTKMKMMCLLSAGFQSWQILGMIAVLTDKQIPLTELDCIQIYSSIACSTLLVCWAATCGLPTIPVPQVFPSGYNVVLRITLKLSWLACTAASRLTAFYIFSTAFSYNLLSLCAARWITVFVVSHIVKAFSSRGVPRPSFARLLVATSVYTLVFVHPQKGHLQHAYGLFYFFYLCENLIVVYTVLDGDEAMSMIWVYVCLALYATGMICHLAHMILHMATPHQVVRIDRREHPTDVENTRV